MKTNVMDLAMKEAKERAMEDQRMAKFYVRMNFQNLVRRAEFMGDVPARKRLSQQIAESVIESHGAFAHLYVLEKMETRAGMDDSSSLWRDVLTWIDELGGDDARGDRGGADITEPRDEQTGSAEDHS